MKRTIGLKQANLKQVGGCEMYQIEILPNQYLKMEYPANWFGVINKNEAAHFSRKSSANSVLKLARKKWSDAKVVEA